MSIIIKGMDMPKGAEQIWVDVWGSQGLLANKILSVDEIVEIPTPHGRLIDKDELLKFFMDYAWDWSSVDGITTTTALKQVIRDVKNAPTILEAEE